MMVCFCGEERAEGSQFCAYHEEMMDYLKVTGEWDTWYERVCEAARRARALPKREIAERFKMSTSTLDKWARTDRVWSMRGMFRGQNGQLYETFFFDPKEIGKKYLPKVPAFLKARDGARLEPLQKVARETGIKPMTIHYWASRETCIRCKRVTAGGKGRRVYVSREDVLARQMQTRVYQAAAGE